ncbi:MAG: glycosyltransferase [Kiritimatiellales bacterium]
METLHEWIQTGFNIAMQATFTVSAAYFLLTVVVLIRRRKKTPATAGGKNLPRVTVQIPTYNELAALNCARRCLEFDYPGDRLQILIGDDSSNSGISKQIDIFAARHPRVKVCRRGSNTGFKPGNLNHMLAETTGDYILIFDSDFLPEKDFLRRIVQPVIEHPELAGVQASWRISNTHQNFTTLLGAGIINIIHIVILPWLKHFANTGVFCGSGELIRKDLLIENGGWTPGALTEDVDYSLRTIAAGNRIAYLHDLPIACEVPYTPRDLFRQQMRWAYGVMRAFIKNGRTLFFSRITHARAKAAAICFAGGYAMVILFMLTLILGVLNAASAWGIDDIAAPVSAGVIGIQTALNFLFASGMLVSSLCASFIAGASIRSLWRLILASFTIGIVLLFFISKGLTCAVFGLPMQWFIVHKNGNSLAAGNVEPEPSAV